MASPWPGIARAIIEHARRRLEQRRIIRPRKVLDNADFLTWSATAILIFRPGEPQHDVPPIQADKEES